MRNSQEVALWCNTKVSASRPGGSQARNQIPLKTRRDNGETQKWSTAPCVPLARFVDSVARYSTERNKIKNFPVLKFAVSDAVVEKPVGTTEASVSENSKNDEKLSIEPGVSSLIPLSKRARCHDNADEIKDETENHKLAEANNGQNSAESYKCGGF
ncbi:hypothetical protein AVEN_232237-1 [Araneus ventricosus]|uniref:Uncharacterized protein n=1 Tax=Araneus ventricosus TaxID=182803 RepID=A0A4Y2J653_ARAVE|nr:hypothetical protein AVEN_232237-1 [Araneus ventricosus]